MHRPHTDPCQAQVGPSRSSYRDGVSVPDPTPDPASARAAYVAFLQDARGRLVVAHDFDADGVAAGVLLQRSLAARDVVRWVPGRLRDAWRDDNRSEMAALGPDRLFLLDLGCRNQPVLPGTPTCVIDHHRPEEPPPGTTLVSGYTWNPPTCTAWMVHDLVQCPDLDWVAALGILSDLGPTAPAPALLSAKERFGITCLNKVVALLNAVRRCSRPDAERAARALLRHEDPRLLLKSDDPDVQALKAAQDEVRQEFQRAKTAAPKFAGQVALIRTSSPCQVHPLLAQIWRSRLPKYYVLVSNDAYVPGRVNFSARSTPPLKVLDFLQGFPDLAAAGDFGRGHDHASGGSLPAEAWQEFLVRLGFQAGAV